MSQQDIASRLLVDPSTVVDFIDQLESRGLLARSRNPKDRRAYLVDLTDEGRRQLRVGDERAHRIQADLFASLSAEEHSTLQKLLERLADTLARRS